MPPSPPPTILDWLTLTIALWGAIVATILGIRETRKEKRKVKVIIEEQLFRKRHHLIITNSGFRPITIQDIHVFVSDEHDEISKDTPWDDQQAPTFPFTFQDGDTKTFLLTSYMSGYIKSKDHRLHVIVHDGEGRTYSKYSEAEYNEKWRLHSKKNKTPAFLIDARYGFLRFINRLRFRKIKSR